MVLRILDKSDAFVSMEKVGLSKEILIYLMVLSNLPLELF